MLRRTFFLGVGASAAPLLLARHASAAQELRVLVHGSFSLPKPLLAQFESDSGIRLAIVKGGDAGEMLNKLILTRAEPIADVVFGIDNLLVAKADAAQVLDPYRGPAAGRSVRVALEGPVVPVDYGYVTLNYDKGWFAARAVALPGTLDELAGPLWRNLVALPNPATSSPGFAFLVATISGLGEEAAFDWWARMRANGLRVTKGWSEAYYTEFSRNGGTRPIVLSYASSPAAEVFYSKEKLTEPPTASLFLDGGVMRQVEGVALVRGARQHEAAGRFIEFLRSAPVQQALQSTMWMYPVETGAARVDALRYAVEPARFQDPAPALVAARGAQWVARWTRVVLK